MANVLLYVLKINVLAAAVILLTAALSGNLTRKYSVRWKYRIWLALAVMLLLPVRIPETWHMVQIQVPAAFALTAENIRDGMTAGKRASADAGTADITAAGAGTAGAGVTVGAGTADTGFTDSKENPETRKQAEAVKSAGGKAMNAPAKDFPGQPELSAGGISMEAAARFAVTLWAAGVLFLAVKKGAEAWMAGKTMRRWNVPNWNRSLQRQYQKLCKRMKLRRAPRLMLNSRLGTPLLMGFRKPCICLPANGYTGEEQELILLHELCHYRRKDLWYKALMNLLCVVYWFNPALWWMKKEADRDIEFLCDETVMETRTVSERMVYNRLLAKTAVGRNVPPGVTTAFNDSLLNLKKRMVNIMRAGTMKKGTAATACVLVLFLTANLLMGCSVKDNSSPAAQADGSQTDVNESRLEQDPETTPSADNKDEKENGQSLDTVPLEDSNGENQTSPAQTGEGNNSAQEKEGDDPEHSAASLSKPEESDDNGTGDSGTSGASADRQDSPDTPSSQPPQGDDTPQETQPPQETQLPSQGADLSSDIELIDYMHSNQVQGFADDLGMEKVEGQMFGEHGSRYENSYAGIEWQYVDETFYDWENPERKHEFIGSVWCKGNSDLSVYGMTCGMNMDEVREQMQADGWRTIGIDEQAFLRAGNSGYNREYVQFETEGTTITEWYWCNWPEGDFA